MNSDDNFLSRWSRRKAQVRQGVLPPEGAATHAPLAVPSAPAPMPEPVPVAQTPLPQALATPQDLAEPSAEPPAPTLDDVARLAPDAADFSRFVAPKVSPAVRNAAMKKLFTDPHFNVMDGLDVYIDDYGLPDPLPSGMLRQMAQSHLLGLFNDEPQQPAAPEARAPGAVSADNDADATPLPDDPALPVALSEPPGPADAEPVADPAPADAGPAAPAA